MNNGPQRLLKVEPAIAVTASWIILVKKMPDLAK
jgi:hypothetical protein